MAAVVSFAIFILAIGHEGRKIDQDRGRHYIQTYSMEILVAKGVGTWIESQDESLPISHQALP